MTRPPALRHFCHARGCRVSVLSRLLMCRRHWAMVPRDLQRAVWDGYRYGQDVDKRPSKEYLRAAKAAVDIVALAEEKTKIMKKSISSDGRSMNPDAKRIVTLERVFRCPICGKVDVHGIDARPVHCGRRMDVERELFRGGDPDQIRVDLVELRGPGGSYLDREDGFGASYFRVPDDWVPAFSLWVLRPGRDKGERIGWLGNGLVGWNWKMVPGMKITEGIASSKEQAIEILWAAINDY